MTNPRQTFFQYYTVVILIGFAAGAIQALLMGNWEVWLGVLVAAIPGTFVVVAKRTGKGGKVTRFAPTLWLIPAAGFALSVSLSGRVVFEPLLLAAILFLGGLCFAFWYQKNPE
ncbi:MAG: hypothetical protein ACWA5K_08400 [bacterium]